MDWLAFAWRRVGLCWLIEGDDVKRECLYCRQDAGSTLVAVRMSKKLGEGT